MFVDSGEGANADTIGDLSEGGSCAIGLNVLANKFHDLLLAFVNDGSHSIKLQRKPESVKGVKMGHFVDLKWPGQRE